MYKVTLLLIFCLSFIKNQAQYLSLPYDDSYGIPIVNVSVDGKNHQFAFDTGAFMTCINSEVFPNLPVSKIIDNVGGISSERKSMNAVKFSFKIIDKEFENKEVIYVDLNKTTQATCNNLILGGIIGRDIMENYIIEINPNDKKISFYIPFNFDKNKTQNFTKIKFQNNRPNIPISIGNHKRFVLFDTGSKGNLSISDFKLDQYISTTQHVAYRSKSSSFGIHGTNNEEDLHHRIYNAEIELGNSSVKNQLIETSNNDFNNMGFGFSKQFISYLDLKNNKLFMKQVEQSVEKYEDSLLKNIGFSIIYNAEQKRSNVTTLRTTNNKLVLGDTIISINEETPPKNNCDTYSFLKKFVGSKMKIIVQRENETKEIEIAASV